MKHSNIQTVIISNIQKIKIQTSLIGEIQKSNIQTFKHSLIAGPYFYLTRGRHPRSGTLGVLGDALWNVLDHFKAIGIL